MLRKDVYPYEYMDDWEKLNKTSLPGKKKDLYSYLKMEHITDADYTHVKSFEIKFMCLKWFSYS